MRKGFIRMYQDQPDLAKTLTNLHKVLGTGAKQADWPATL
jgi:hypothetical protein